MFYFGCLNESQLSPLSSSIRIYLLVIGMYSFQELICRWWKLIFFKSQNQCMLTCPYLFQFNIIIIIIISSFSRDLFFEVCILASVSRTLRSILSDLKMISFCGCCFFLWFLIPPECFLVFGDRSKCTNYIWFHRYLHVTQLLYSLEWWKYFSIFSLSQYYYHYSVSSFSHQR